LSIPSAHWGMWEDDEALEGVGIPLEDEEDELEEEFEEQEELGAREDETLEGAGITPAEETDIALADEDEELLEQKQEAALLTPEDADAGIPSADDPPADETEDIASIEAVKPLKFAGFPRSQFVPSPILPPIAATKRGVTLRRFSGVS